MMRVVDRAPVGRDIEGPAHDGSREHQKSPQDDISHDSCGYNVVNHVFQNVRKRKLGHRTDELYKDREDYRALILPH